MIPLRVSHFDSKKNLLDELRINFPGGTISFTGGVKNDHIQEYWRWLTSQYDSTSALRVQETHHLGLQQGNYWILNHEVRIKRQKMFMLVRKINFCKILLWCSLQLVWQFMISIFFSIFSGICRITAWLTYSIESLHWLKPAHHKSTTLNHDLLDQDTFGEWNLEVSMVCMLRYMSSTLAAHLPLESQITQSAELWC